MYRKGEVPAARRSQVRVLCIDNHASLNYVCLLLARSGYMVNRAGFLCDALDLIHGSSYDLYVVNDKLACGPGEDPFEKVRKAAGTTPIVFYKTVVCPFDPRSADQCGSTPQTPVPLTEVPVAVGRALLTSPRPITSTRVA